VLETERIDGHVVSVHINGQQFACEEETGYTTVPKEFLSGFRLSDIPDDISIKPVEKIESNTIHITNDIALTGFGNGSASATVQEMFRRKFWDGDVGLSPHVAALRESIAENEAAAETHFDDDDDYIFLHYEVTITEDLEIAAAIQKVEGIITAVRERADQLVARHRDRLLGIFDRGSFDADLAHNLGKKGHSVGLLMIDIDHFKQVNDTHGHQVGDAVLQALAKVLVNHSSRDVVPYRYGGEELAVFLAKTRKSDAVALAESLRGEIEKLRVDRIPDLQVTASIGVAVADGDGPDDLVKKADSALYKAKHCGRNRVESG
jgi:diguanylate cyclase (GGDEF)-like protein